jgi:hypothetical protein
MPHPPFFRLVWRGTRSSHAGRIRTSLAEEEVSAGPLKGIGSTLTSSLYLGALKINPRLNLVIALDKFYFIALDKVR